MDHSGNTTRNSDAAAAARSSGSGENTRDRERGRGYQYADLMAAMRNRDPRLAWKMLAEVATVCRRIVESGEPVAYSLCWHVAVGLEWMHEAPDTGWQSDLFSFVRWMKAHPDLDGKTAKHALQEVERVTAEWPTHLGPSAARTKRAAESWNQWFGVPAEDARVEFLDVWDKVRVVPGKSLLDYAIEVADRRPISFGNGHLSIDTDGYKRFVSLAGWLQVTRGNGPVFLPCDLLAEKLGVQKMTVSRYRRLAIKDKFLVETKPHRFSTKPDAAPNTATEFRFDVERVPMLKDAAQGGTAQSFLRAKDGVV